MEAQVFQKAKRGKNLPPNHGHGSSLPISMVPTLQFLSAVKTRRGTARCTARYRVFHAKIDKQNSKHEQKSIYLHGTARCGAVPRCGAARCRTAFSPRPPRGTARHRASRHGAADFRFSRKYPTAPRGAGARCGAAHNPDGNCVSSRFTIC